MKAPGKIQLTVWLLGLAGAALFTVLLIRQGVGQVLDAFATGEWAIMGIVVYHLIPIFLDAIAWWVLFPKSDRLPLLNFFGCAGSANRSAHLCLRPPSAE